MTMMALEESGALAKTIEQQLKTLVVYSDPAAANKAMTLKQRLLQESATTRSVRTAWWAVDSLKDKVLFDAACRHASDSDLVFLALTISDKLPPEIKKWLEAVFQQNNRPHPALVALLGANGKPPTGINVVDSYLHEQARCAGVDYFIYWHRQKPLLSADFMANQERIPSTCPARATSRPNTAGVPRWGINE